MDLLNLIKDKPADFDVRHAQQMSFVGDKSHIDPVHLVLYDDTNYFDTFSNDEIMDLVKKRKLEGSIVSINQIKEMAILLLDSYSALANPHSSLEERLKTSQRICDFLEKVRLM